MRHWLVDIRKAQKRTQGEVAEGVGISQGFYCAIEKGVRTPSVATAKSIANTLGVDWTRFYE